MNKMSRSKAASRTRARVPRTPHRSRSSAAAPSLTGARLNIAFCILLAVATIAFYSPVLGHPFIVLDDREYVTANPHIRSLGWDTIKWAFTAMDAANWHPLTWLSHALDYKLFALNPTGHHLTSLLIHVCNVVLLFLGLTWITKRTGPSLLVAALFALHPINVESVAWVAERKNVLSTFFFLLTLAAYAWYAQKPDWRRYLLTTAAFAAALLAKPMAVTLPFVLLLLDYWPLERMHFGGAQKPQPNASGAQSASFWWLVLEKVPLLVLSATSSLVTLKAQHAVVQSFEEFPLRVRLGNALVAYGLYLWKMVWPSQLAFYPHPLVAPPLWQWLLSGAVLLAVTAVVIAFRDKRYMPVGWFWFLGTLVPVLGLVQVGGYAMADRYAYIPLIGIFIMIAWGLADLAKIRDLRPAWRVVPALCVLAALGGITVHQIGYWDSDYHLDSHMLAVAETPFAHNAVAMALLNPAAALTEQELASFPSEPARMEEARKHFERALELRQSHAERESSLWDKAGTLNNLANLDRMENRLDEARAHDEAALEIYRHLAQQNPDVYLPYLAVTLNNLGAVSRLQNRLDEARLDYAESLAIDRELAQQNPVKYLPNLALILNEYGLVQANLGHAEDARATYEEALKINRQLAQQSPEVYLPQLAMTLQNYALLDVVQHRMDEARARYEEALKIDRQLVAQNSAVYLPDLAMTLSNLARLNQLQGWNSDARAQYQEALGILRTLVQVDRKYAEQFSRVQAGLQELERSSTSQQKAISQSLHP